MSNIKTGFKKAYSSILVLIAGCALFFGFSVLASDPECYDHNTNFVCCGQIDGEDICCEKNVKSAALEPFSGGSQVGCRYKEQADIDALAAAALGDDDDDASTADDDDDGDASAPKEINVKITNPLKANTIEDVLNNIIDFIFWLALVICPLIIIVGGFIFVTAAGDPKKVETGKRMIFYALIGLGVVILAKGFVLALKTILGVKKTGALDLLFRKIA